MGAIVCLNAPCEFAIKAFDLKVRNTLKNLKTKEFFCSGSTLWAYVNALHPMGFVMQERSLVFF